MGDVSDLGQPEAYLQLLKLLNPDFTNKVDAAIERDNRQEWFELLKELL